MTEIEISEKQDYLREFQGQLQEYVTQPADDWAIEVASKKARYLADQVIIAMYPDPSEVAMEVIKSIDWQSFRNC